MGRFTGLIDQLEPTPADVPVLDPAADARMRLANPDTAAESQRLASQIGGLPASVIEANLDEVKSRETAARFRTFLRDAPEVRTLGDDFNAVAKDDVDTLDRIRIAGKNMVAAGWTAAGGGYGILAATEDTLASVAGYVGLGPSPSLRALPKDDPRHRDSAFTQSAELLLELQKSATLRADELTAENERVGIFEQSVYSGLQSVVTNAPMIAAGLAAKNPQIALAGMSGLVFGNEYGTGREAGLTVGQSLLYGGTQAGIEYATEKIPTGLLFGDIAKKTGLLQTLLKQTAAEVPNEQIATFTQDFTTWVTLNPEKTTEQFLAERPEAAYRTLVSTVVAAGVQGTVVHQIGTRMSAEAAQAEEREGFLKELSSLAEASKLRERSPEQFARYVEAVAPDTDIFLDAADAEKLMQSDLEIPDDLDDRIAEAAEHDTPVRITAAEYATYLAGSPAGQALAARARVGSAVAMNAEEAKKIESEFAARAEQAIVESDNAEAARIDARKINESVLAQIQSTGRFRSDVASAYASLVENFFVTMAQRSGMSASDLFAQYPLRVQAAGEQPVADTLEQLPAEAFKVVEEESTAAHANVVIKAGDQGSMDLVDFGDKLQVQLVVLKRSSRGQGIGQQLIMRAYEEAQRRGKQLVSDRAVSVHQLRVYEALRRKGWAIEYADPEQVRTVLELADREGVDARKDGTNTLGAHALLGDSVVRRIAPPGETQLNQSALQPVAARAAEAGELPEGFTRFRHFGNFDVPVLDPEFMGTGMRGEERRRGGPRVTSLYPDTGFQKESGVGPVEYAVDVPTEQLYNANADPLGLAAQSQEVVAYDSDMQPVETRFDMDAFEQAVKDAGFAGYTTPGAEGNLRGQARLFQPVPVIGARVSEVEEATALFQLHPDNEPQGFDLVAAHLTEEERSRLMRHTAKKLVDVFKSLPADKDFADAARAGAAKRGWYANAVRTLRQVFGDVDAPRFAALLAATSPQVGVQINLQNAASIWKLWDEKGRPTSKQEINAVMDEALGGRDSILNAWRNNTVRALSGEDPHAIVLSGPKVNSFMRNLMGDTQEVTNDTWMANFAAINQTVFSGSMKDPIKSGPGKRPGYLAYIAKIRRVAQKLSTPEHTWTPAEVQETIWSWTKTAYELADVAGETRSVEQLVRDGEITDARVAGASDFATMLKDNAPIRTILEAAGYGDEINAIETEFGDPASRNTTRAPVTPALLRSARRLDEVRARRAAESEERQVEAGPLDGTLLNIGMAVNDGSKLTREQIVAKLEEMEAKIEKTVVYTSDTEPTLVVKLTSPLSKSEMDALSEDLKQEAVVQVIDGQGAVYGPQAEKWGPYNPEFFLTLDGRRASEVEALQQPEREEAAPLQQKARGQITMGRDLQVTPSVVTLFEQADLSTFLHESGHFFFEVMADLAARPNAPAAIRADMETLLKWVKFSGTVEEWKATPIKARREAHEKFARGFEAWLLEGNAPNEEMRGLFHRFRAWLVQLYKSVERLNVALTDEVRTVMAGLVATEEQIKDAEAARSYAPLFLSADAAGMTPEEWQAYQDTTRAATEHAQDALQARSMRNLRWLDNARTRELKKLQAQNADKRKAVQAEVETEIAQQPARVAETLILDGAAWVENLVDGKPEQIKLPTHKLSVESLQEAYGTREEYRETLKASGVDASTARAPWESLPRAMLTKGEGLSADEVAELTGFTSGDQLITELLALPPRAAVVERETNRRMLERYGDVNNPQTLARAVDLAVHNQHRTHVVASELQALDESLKTQPGGITTVKRAARDYAAKVVQRQKIREVRPAQYLAAETRAARDARVLLANGNLKAAAVRKRDQLFNGYASREASKAMDMVDKGLRYLRRFDEAKVRGQLDPSYRDQIDKLLERYDLRRRSLTEVDKRAALATWIKEQEAEGNEPIIPEELVDESRKTNYQNLTIEGFQGLVDAVTNIEHLARLKRRLLVAKEQRDFDTAVTELVTSIDANAPKGKSKVQLERDLSMWGRFADTINEWFTHLRKMSSIARQIDGGNDGGKFWSYMMQPVNAAADQEVSMRSAATKKLNALLDTLPALRTTLAQRIGHKVKGPPKMYVPEVGVSLSLEARLAVALNWGNDGNRERIKEGNQWTDAQAEAVINTLTKEEMDFVQKVFYFIGTYWSDIAAKEERVTGVRPVRVESVPINTRHGTYEGGYYPIVADPGRSEKAAQQNDAELISQSLRGAVTRATTRRGHTKARVGGKDPVRLDLGVLTQHVGQVIHDLSWHEALIDAGRLLRDKRVSGSLREHYGAEVTRLMRKTLDDVARGEVIAQDAGERLVNHFRVGATIAGLGLSATTSLLQFTGLTQSLVRVGYVPMGKALLEFTARPLQSIAAVRAKSTFMRDRGLVLNRELGEITNRLEGSSRLARFYFLPIQAMQVAVDTPTWLAAYGKAFGAGETEDRAIAIADQAVRDSQSSGQVQDLAEVQRGGAYKKLFTNFYSYFSATYQLSAESIQGFKRDPSITSGLKMGSDFLMLYTVPALLGLLIREGLRGDLDDKEPEELAEALLKAQLSAMLGVYPFVRELGGAFMGFEYRGPAGLGFLAHSTALIKQVEQGDIDEPMLRAANRAAGNAFHYPAGQVDRTVRGLIAISEGDAGPQAILLGPPAKEE